VTDRTKIILDESEIPRQWYNVIPDLPSPMPHPAHRPDLWPHYHHPADRDRRPGNRFRRFWHRSSPPITRPSA